MHVQRFRVQCGPWQLRRRARRRLLGDCSGAKASEGDDGGVCIGRPFLPAPTLPPTRPPTPPPTPPPPLPTPNGSVTHLDLGPAECVARSTREAHSVGALAREVRGAWRPSEFIHRLSSCGPALIWRSPRSPARIQGSGRLSALCHVVVVAGVDLTPWVQASPRSAPASGVVPMPQPSRPRWRRRCRRG